MAAKQHRNYYAPVTRVYSYGSTAAELAPSEREERFRERGELPVIEEQRREEARQKLAPQVRANPKRRVAILAGVCLTAAALLLVLVRYAKIAAEYSTVNSLKSDIEQAELNLAALNVELQLAVSLEDAEATAKAAGMSYPTASQIHRVGEPLSGTEEETEQEEASETTETTETTEATETAETTLSGEDAAAPAE